MENNTENTEKRHFIENSAENTDKHGLMESIIKWIIDHDSKKIKKYVDKLREQNKGLSNEELAQKVVNREAIMCGIAGAITGIGGFLTMPITVPIDVYCSLKTQAFMAYCVSYIYGSADNTVDMKRDIYLIIAGDAAKTAFKKIGIDITEKISKKVIEQYIAQYATRQVYSVLFVEFGREGALKILADELAIEIVERVIAQNSKTIFNKFFRKIIPLVGAPIGFAFDWTMAKMVGKRAISYYSGK